MDITQAGQMITWLDEEHRRDKAQLTELRQRVEGQSVEIKDQNKRIQELEGRLAATQARLSHFTTVEQSIQHVRDELVLMVRAQEEDIARYQREQSKVRQLEQETISRSVGELRRHLDAIPPLQERLVTLRAEDQRLGEALLSLQTRLTAHERQTASLPDRISYVEGLRTQDVQGITKIQEEILELLRRTEATAGKQGLIEDMARKNEQRINAIVPFRDEILKRHAQLAEDLRLREALVERQIKDWQSVVAHFEEQLGNQRKIIERYTQRSDEVQQYLSAIEEYKDSINREQKQVTELQRMAEVRQRRELEEWIAAYEQRWTKFRLEREAQWNQQIARNEEVTLRTKQLEESREADLEQVRKLARQLIAIQDEYRGKLRELWAVQERAALFQLDEVRRWYDEISAVVADKVGNR